MLHVSAAELEQLDRFYTFREREEVLRFLERYPFLVPLLVQAYDKVGSYFPGARLYLEVIGDPEEMDDNELIVFIATNLAARAAVERLKRLYEGWWLYASAQARGKLAINLECL
jgi:hypothetical protein